ncbi:MAG: hypothetical protein IJM38_06675 [Ruminococcus sp.]|nr:hypothetical protein [Ruminococcus sp.]
MKNIIKKVSAIAMAFTLLGTGTAITKNVSPETTTPSITASAACSHHGYCYRSTGNWETYHYELVSLNKTAGVYYIRQYQRRLVSIHCGSCSKVTSSFYEYRTI